jgi:SAM-dependent methyltransferase
MTRQFSAACERNREPILAILRQTLTEPGRVLEIGSGTGQHAAYFGAHLPHLTWQTSDLPQNHASIAAWLNEARPPNVLPPLTLDAASTDWPPGPYDAVFTANTCHIMAWDEVRAMFAGAARVLRPDGLMCVYGPFNYGGRFTSESNALFDASLKAQAEHMGVRDFEAVNQAASECGLALVEDYAMPAHNRLVVWKRS